MLKKTKIIATIWPSSNHPNIISRLIRKGMDVARINMAHNNNEKEITDDQNIINGRALTNIGTFRAYIQAYLRDNSNIHKEMTFLVRQLSPESNGVPIEIYVFLNVLRFSLRFLWM